MKNCYIINLNSIRKVKDFTDDIREINPHVDIDLRLHRYTIDARSIMGIFSLNLAENLECIIHSEDVEEVRKFDEIMQKYEAKDYD